MALTVVALGRLLLSLLVPVNEQDPEPVVSERHRVFLAILIAPLFVAAVFAESLLRWASLSLQFIFW
jgi:hypothetical protein